MQQTLLGSLRSTAGLTLPQTQLLGEQPWSRSGFAPLHEAGLGRPSTGHVLSPSQL